MDTAFPELPFNGQIFIDAFRMRWIFDSDQRCWVRSGSVSDLPVATELQPGLLSANLKQVLDSLPEKAGSFGIVTKPLLSLSQNKPKAIIRDKVAGVSSDDSGTTLNGLIPKEGRNYAVEQFVGKLLRFKTGLLRDKVFLIFTNDTNKIFLDGNAIKAAIGDEFEILEPSGYNPSGVLLGDIVLVSESLDITCVDSNGETLPEGCNVNKILADDPDNPPALNFRLNENFLNNLCVTIPGCQGARGDRGDKGDEGAPGTGDGPTGDTGDPGLDAIVAENFAGIKIVELDDIFDTAVVGLELDAANGVLGVVKAKVRTPGNETPANQIVSTPVSRSIKFTDPDSFQYEILMPPAGDPVGDADVAIVKYPRKYTPENSSRETTVSKVMLSDLIDRVVSYYESKLSEINDDYNQSIKDYINGKDAEARTILADLADELARCEFELPIDFCLGISPGDCNPLSTANGGSLTTSTAGGFPYPLASTFFAVTDVPSASDLGVLSVIPSSSDRPAIEVNITYPSVEADLGQVTLPTGGYVIQWISGTVKSSSTNYLIGSETIGVGLEAEVVDGVAAPVIFKMPVPSAPFNPNDSSSVELAYQEAPIIEKAMPIEITDPSGGTIKLRAPLPGTNASGNLQLRVIRVDLS